MSYRVVYRINGHEASENADNMTDALNRYNAIYGSGHANGVAIEHSEEGVVVASGGYSSDSDYEGAPWDVPAWEVEETVLNPAEIVKNKKSD